MGRVVKLMLMEMYTMVSGKMINYVVMESILTKMELSTKDNGKKISNMVKVSKHGLMERVMMVGT